MSLVAVLVDPVRLPDGAAWAASSVQDGWAMGVYFAPSGWSVPLDLIAVAGEPLTCHVALEAEVAWADDAVLRIRVAGRTALAVPHLDPATVAQALARARALDLLPV